MQKRAYRANAGVAALRVMAAAQVARMREWLRFARRLRRVSRECENGRALRNDFDVELANAGVAALRETAAARVARMRE